MTANITRTIEEMKEEAKLAGELEGEIRGEIKGKLEVAKKMLEAGMSIESVASMTELTIDEIKKLKDELI